MQAPQDQSAATLSPTADLLAAVEQTQGQLSAGGPLVAVFEEGAELPTQDDPVIALVLTPSPGSGTSGTDTGPQTVVDGTPQATPDVTPDSAPDSAPVSTPPTSPDTAPDGAPSDTAETPWVFPFDQPLPPADGDNQALATVTNDGSVVYDVAFALVWVEGDEVLNVNEAHAYASCSNCVAVAVAFQVVLVLDNAHVVVPQNLAVSANYNCFSCITAAIASQLVLSVDEPGEEQLLTLGAIWSQLMEFAATITSYSVTEIMEQLETFQSEIVAILAAAPTADTGPSASGSESGDPSSTVTPGSGSPTPEPTQSSASPTTQPTTGSPSPSPTDTSTSPSLPSDSPTASPTPSPTDSPSSPSSDPQSSTSTPTSEPPTSPSASLSDSPPSSTATPEVTQEPMASASP